jgi:hypothetical protein
MDILGKDDVNNLIDRHPKIEKDNYKLWLTSTNIMERILHNTIYNQSLIEIENILFQVIMEMLLLKLSKIK